MALVIANVLFVSAFIRETGKDCMEYLALPISAVAFLRGQGWLVCLPLLAVFPVRSRQERSSACRDRRRFCRHNRAFW